MVKTQEACQKGVAAPPAKYAAKRVLVLYATISVLASAAIGSPLFAAFPGAREVAFTILSDQEPIGRHSVTFEQRGQDLVVDIDIAIEVRFAFLTLFRYQHSNREVWRDGRLVSLNTSTDDDGTRYTVTARATPDGIWIEGAAGRYLAPLDIVPTSYWNPITVEQSRLLDTQRGAILDVNIKPIGNEVITVGDTRVSVKRFTVDGDLKLDVWYTDRGEWTKMAFETRGATINYKPKIASTGQIGVAN